MFGINKEKLSAREALENIREEVERYSFRFRLYCKDAYGTGRRIPRIEKFFFLRAEREILDLINAPLRSIDTEGWLQIVYSFGFLCACYERILILGTSPLSQGTVNLSLPDPAMLEYYTKLKHKEDARYEATRQRNRIRGEHFRRCKEMGMTDAEAYREIIRQERPDLKPNTGLYRAAMEALKVWKNRNLRK